MKTMLILGADRIAQKALTFPDVNATSILVVIDRSTSLGRLFRLIWRRRLSLMLVFKMLKCQCFRNSVSIPQQDYPEIKCNSDLLNLIDKYHPARIILFRAGLVINKEIISRGIPLLNIHCANIPEYGGLGSIDRAISDRSIYQNATLHQVTTTIDEGIVFDAEPYLLDIKKSYCHNENIAYEAGLRLLLRSINSDIGIEK
ncbi:MAG: formyltransferase family protein [Methylotenera sp.]